MNKKLFGLIIPLAVVTLAGCVKYNGRNKDGSPKTDSTSASTSEPNTEAPTATTVPVTPGEKVTYYLNLGKHGKLKGSAGTEQKDVFLEYAVKVEGTSGDALPTKDDVTSDLTGVVFENWILSGSQEIYTQVPTKNNCILVAVYSGSGEGGGSGGGGGGSAVTPRTSNLPNTGYGFKFGDGTAYIGSAAGQDYSGREQVVIKNAYFLKGETFQLFNFAPDGGGWAEPVDPWSFGGSETSENWKQYLELNGKTNYKVLKDFTSEEIYIKLRYEDNIVYFK